ncbi:MMPL family transporter [Actinacidiphila paucisporea]|uniref:Putative drug exporter of the RND superfamily n=1 Tax=Actinacidiphila paucisporea TaxID=310782 RepID=A0A1M7NPE0_9ACTN|nr:MMPL family transporter [Actinacidiphila paucisporea]SHN05264.1 putative drug exporter of the RND superfamily [Actinacidiphila paucisporea]
MDHSVSESVRLSGTARLAQWSVRHRWLVIALWVVLALAGAVAASQSSSRLSFTFDLPGQPAFETNSAIVSRFGSGGDNPPLVAVVHLPAGANVDSPGVERRLAAAFDSAAKALPGARTASYPATHDRAFVSADGRTTFALLYPVPDFTSSDPYSKALPALTRSLADVRVAGAPVHVTGASVLASGGSSSGNSVLAETLFAGVAALVVLAVVFGSLLALLPLLIAAVAIPSAFVVIYALTYATTMSTLVQNIVALVGLGVAIDYALLVVTRWREELARNTSGGTPGGAQTPLRRAAPEANRGAVIASAGTAGSSVVFSGVTVAVSLAALALTPVPFLRSIGLAGMLIPLFSIGVSTTLLPVVLDAIGPRMEWPRKKPASTTSRMWTAIATWVVAHRVIAAAGSLAVLGLLIAPLAGLNLGEPQAKATASTASADAKAGFRLLDTSGIGAGVLRPTEVLTPAAATYPAPRGITVAAPPAWQRGSLRVVDAWSPADPSSAAGKDTLSAVRSAAAKVPGARIGGSPAQDADFIDALYGPNVVFIIAAIVILTVLLLTRALRSVWLPVKALLLNAMSLAAAFGVLTFVWQQGHATQTLFNAPATGAVTLWVPLAVFALLFGLSMDYEVFILTRINEEYATSGSTDKAVIAGIGHTGRLVTSGALILFLAFVALGGVPQTDVKILSTGLAAGIILDATIIRGILAPALVALLGRFNWWMPTWVARALRIRPLVAPDPGHDAATASSTGSRPTPGPQ